MKRFLAIAGGLAFVLLLMPAVGLASHVTANISTATAERYAWNDVIGWIDFGNGEVEVKNSQLKGYAFSPAVGAIALDCETSPAPGCGSGDPWRVSNAELGKLAGWAWNDAIGWVSFCGSGASGSQWDEDAGKWKCPDTPVPTYQVTVDPDTREFSGWAWNDAVGWISFNCSNTNGCGTSSYRVKTEWDGVLPNGSLVSSTFELCSTAGCKASLNAILWYGDPLIGDAEVGFQVAVSDSAPPTDFKGPGGTASSGDLYSGEPGEVVALLPAVHGSGRYFRYKLFLTPCNASCSKPTSPVVKDVIINISP